jgi:site-specific DNA-methyltransferase (adenine-specific)
MSRPSYRVHDGHLHFPEVTVPENTVIHGDCVKVMAGLPDACVDFVLTDPPYVCGYRDRQGRTVANDNRSDWLEPAFRKIYRLMKPDTLCVSFYGWTALESFLGAWSAAGFRRVGHIVFCKDYASRTGMVRAMHESAFVLAKGCPPMPRSAPNDVSGWRYTGNRLHPTQKPVEVLTPLIEAYCPSGGLVLDPFAGSGSILVAAQSCARFFIGVELDQAYVLTARQRVVTGAP